jgi:glycosyltransferase involved in cell wall biosynthesis
MPVVSVLMAFHRDTPFLRPAIASVLGQTLSDLELVLVDDGTGLQSDALGEAGRDPRLRWLRQPRQMGIVAAHNAAVAVSQGEFIALLDHDDVMLPTRLQRQVARLRSEPNLGLVSSLAETIDESGRVVGSEFALTDADEQRTYTQYAAPVVTPAYTGRREVFRALPYRPEFPFAADFDFLARAAEQWRMVGVEEVLLHYRRHPVQTTQQHADAIERSRCEIRLLAARRRAGRPESLASVTQDQPPPAFDSCRRMVQRCYAEGFHSLAIYHARRSVALRRSLASAAWACRHALRSLRRLDGVERRRGWQLLLRGPVKAHGLRPVVADNIGQRFDSRAREPRGR